MASLSNRTIPRAAATAGRIVGTLVLLAFVCPSWTMVASAVELVDRNPFDPHRKPWKVPPTPQPELPVLTPQDLQIEAIVSFGSMRGIIAQLDGKLRGTLPGNAAGKVRINVGQSFGAGYVLESVAANQVVVLGGSARYTIPIVRKMNRGSAPVPATMAVEQRAAQPATLPFAAPLASPQAGTPGVAGVAPAPAAQTETTIAPAPPPAQAASAPTAAPQTPPQQPMSLLEAIQAAQAAARNQQNPSQPVVNPFAIPKK
ncbi:MAG: hypothetical protein NT159_19030 [Proteobacteria bacterium]|nr:hypothetical protein [Pseudomonadota bacterium]